MCKYYFGSVMTLVTGATLTLQQKVRPYTVVKSSGNKFKPSSEHFSDRYPAILNLRLPEK
jgi:hypothetical protein